MGVGRLVVRGIVCRRRQCAACVMAHTIVPIKPNSNYTAVLERAPIGAGLI